MEAFNGWLQQNHDWIFFVFAPLPLLHHFFTNQRDILISVLIAGLVVILSGSILIMVSISHEPMPLGTVAGILTLYCTVLFALLSDAIMRGLGKYLTAKRGEKWPKELEYVYLTMAAIGVIGSLNRAEFLTGRLDATEIISAALLATAVVFRFLKTRVEINEWNKAKTWETPAVEAAEVPSAPPPS